MTQKTWFLPPDFNFLPDGELALGTVIKHPMRPTLALASLGQGGQPEIVLPDINILHESEHLHSRGSKRSISAELFAKCVDLASASGKVEFSSYKNRSLDAINLEVRSFKAGIHPDSLKEIMKLERVKKHIDGGIFGKRPVYIITGLRVAKESFRVTDEIGSSNLVSVTGSGPAPAGLVPVEIGGGLSSGAEKSKADGYGTAPGIVFAYRLHVIRAKKDGDVETELFSHRTAFLTGEGDEDEEVEEMECTDVTTHVMNDDLEVEPDFEEYPLWGGEESFVVFK
ncbi:hypothetical protein CGLO_11935 [Colletotrichum gloeosporioides Cg-14]|uniref:Uncharacterized protein n=1 Tax=Colletotrichum gloeosporioides (strain Cg-14) TaxID=1237896 RepID=T0K9Y8_COLGC|nr:hypothetical protein CGLO_11935 [Colletotrichum gloeosporioides Cg-14]